MKRYGFLIAVPDTCVPIVVLQILYDELLANIDHPIEIFSDKVQQFYSKFVRANS